MRIIDWIKTRFNNDNKKISIIIPPETESIHIDLTRNLDVPHYQSGLYFLYSMTVIDGHEIYAVKIGRSDDIGKRMYTYRTHTPFMILGGIYPIVCYDTREMCAAERACHIKLHDYSIPNVICGGEWEIVSKESYNLLIEKCGTNEAFKKTVDEWRGMI